MNNEDNVMSFDIATVMESYLIEGETALEAALPVGVQNVIRALQMMIQKIVNFIAEKVLQVKTFMIPANVWNALKGMCASARNAISAPDSFDISSELDDVQSEMNDADWKNAHPVAASEVRASFNYLQSSCKAIIQNLKRVDESEKHVAYKAAAAKLNKLCNLMMHACNKGIRGGIAHNARTVKNKVAGPAPAAKAREKAAQKEVKTDQKAAAKAAKKKPAPAAT